MVLLPVAVLTDSLKKSFDYRRVSWTLRVQIYSNTSALRTGADDITKLNGH
jgi:hypothetical protein